jgi:hypothetical protein
LKSLSETDSWGKKSSIRSGASSVPFQELVQLENKAPRWYHVLSAKMNDLGYSCRLCNNVWSDNHKQTSYKKGCFDFEAGGSIAFAENW